MSGTRQGTWIIGLVLVTAWTLLVWQHHRSYPSISSDATPAQIAESLDAIFERAMARFQIAGAAAGAFRNGELIWSRQLGVRNTEAAPVTENTAFNVGSVSKPVAVWTTLHLAQQDKLALDAPIGQYMQRWQFAADAPDPEGASVRRTLQHTSGFNRPGYGGYAVNEIAPADALALATQPGGEVAQRIAAGQRRAYSGGGYLLLQLMLEDLTGQDYPAIVSEQLFQPLGMRDSGFNPATLPQPSQAFASGGRQIESLRDLALTAAGAWLSADDTERFIAAHWGEPELLNAGLRTEAFAPTEPSPDYAMSYTRIDTPGGLLLGHGGNNSTWHAQIQVRPATKDGFYFLTNTTTGAQLDLALGCAWRSWAMAQPAATVCAEQRSLTDKLSAANLLVGWVAIAIGLWLLQGFVRGSRRMQAYPKGRSARRTIGRGLTALTVLAALALCLVMFHTDAIYWREDVLFIDEIPLHEVRLLMPAIEALLVALLLTLWSRPAPATEAAAPQTA